jgi:uncharacterized protein (TIGR03066 family)
MVAMSAHNGLSADDKIDAKKLIGKWEPKEKKEDAKIVIEFLKDGKPAVTVTGAGKDAKLDGTYKLDGSTLTTTLKIGDAERKRTRTITKLTDTEMVSSEEQAKEETLIRIKDK